MAKVDNVVKQMLEKAYDTAKEMLYANIDILERIADYLYEHETISGKEFMDIFSEMRAAREPVDVEGTVSDLTEIPEDALRMKRLKNKIRIGICLIFRKS